MTLVLSEVSHRGIAMAADSAVAFPSGRVYVGAQKLQCVPQIAAGMSVWGCGSVGNEDTDVWLQRFIRTDVEPTMTLWQAAERLADQLNCAFRGVGRDRMGVHVRGFDQHEGVRGPALYHVHKGNYGVGINHGHLVIIPTEPPSFPQSRYLSGTTRNLYPPVSLK